MNNNVFLMGILFVLASFIIDLRLGLLASTIVIAVFLIIFVRYKNMITDRNMNFVENYEPTTIGKPKTEKNDAIQYAKRNQKMCMTSDQFKYYSDPAFRKPQIVEKNMVSLNHRLEGAQNPKTLIPPMITRPMYDMGWRKNTQVVPNIINGQTNDPIGRSGYLSEHDLLDTDLVRRPIKLPDEVGNGEIIENFVERPEQLYDEKTWDNSILVGRGYDASQFEASHFPANYPQGNAMRNPELYNYNKRLFTQSVQPGVQYRSDVIEPVNSNIGISFQQQFNPRTYEEKNGNLEIVDHDPNFAPPHAEIIEPPEEPTQANVYDPRFYGYGTSYRNYVDDVTGQPRFPYDDINATRMPNYVVRSKIDTHRFADVYGSVQNSGVGLNEIRNRAQDAFYEDTNHFRNDITTRLMRKRNAEMWQEKMYPKSRAYRR